MRNMHDPEKDFFLHFIEFIVIVFQKIGSGNNSGTSEFKSAARNSKRIQIPGMVISIYVLIILANCHLKR